ncbi:unnamed protein product [Discosporangium mesarthrocarpum]
MKIYTLIVSFNNKKYKIYTDKFLTIDNLIKFFYYQKFLMIIELNNKIVNQHFLNKIYLKNIDLIEIISVVGGG